MPTPIDLTGQRFGKLVVIARGTDQRSSSGKKIYKTWDCLCDCGRTETIRSHRLPYCDSNRARKDVMTACTHCQSQRTCSVCNKPFISIQYKACCSEQCYVIHWRRIDLDAYYRKLERNPEFNRQKQARLHERAAADPSLAKRLAEYTTRAAEIKKHRRKTDEEYKAHVNKVARKRYASLDNPAEKKRERRKQRLLEMTSAQYEAWAERRREYARLYARTRRSTPQGRQRYLECMREYMREQALRNLFAVGDELIKRSIENE